MTESIREISPVELFCPRCRIEPDLEGRLFMDGLGRSLSCGDCHVFYPVIEGVPVLHPEVDKVVQNALGAHSVIWPGDVEAWCNELAKMTTDQQAYREASLLSSYAVSHYPEGLEPGFVRDALRDQGSLEQELDRILSKITLDEGPSLELGCGPGALADVWVRHGKGPVILSDTRLFFSRLAHVLLRFGTTRIPRHRCGSTFTPYALNRAQHPAEEVYVTVADALCPPFPVEEFALMAAMNLLDSVAEPWVLLGQMDAMLHPGGVMVLSLPYQDLPDHRPAPGIGLGTPQDLLEVLRGKMPGLEQLDYEIVEAVDELPWSVVAHDRLVHRFATQLIVARKSGTTS